MRYTRKHRVKTSSAYRILSIVTISITILTVYMTARSAVTIYMNSSNSEVDTIKNDTECRQNKLEAIGKELKIQQEIKDKASMVRQAEESEQDVSSNKMERLNEKIKDYMGSEYSNISVVYLDLSTNETLNINSNEIEHTASTIKVPIVMIILDMINNGDIKEDETMMYDEQSDYEDGAGELQYMDKSSPIAIMQLCEYAIRYSDNIAVNMLARRIGHDDIVPILSHTIGTQWGDAPNKASSSAMTAVLKRIYDGSNPYYAKEIEWLENTVFHDRLDKYITDCKVAHKIGDYAEYVHDIGIVYSDRPYIVSIYTHGLSNSYEQIAQISKIIYDERQKE